MMAATAIMATLTASVVVVMRSGYAVWNAQEADIDILDNGGRCSLALLAAIDAPDDDDRATLTAHRDAAQQLKVDDSQ
mgnify:CR=1 FL=1